MRDLLTSLACAAAGLALIGCGGGSTTSARTADDLRKAMDDHLVLPMQKIDENRSKLEERLGEPDEEDDAAMKWFARDGENCKVLVVTKMGTNFGGMDVTSVKCPEPPP